MYTRYIDQVLQYGKQLPMIHPKVLQITADKVESGSLDCRLIYRDFLFSKRGREVTV